MVLLASAYDQSRFLKAADLEREKKFRVKSVTEEEVGERKERKLVVWFTNDEHGLVLNKTNNRVLRGAFGDDCEGWKGKVIAVFPTMVDVRGKMTAALRVRIPPPKQAAAAAAPAAVTPAPKPAPSGNGAAAAPAAAAAATAPAAAATPKPAAEVDPELADEPVKPLGDEMEDEIPF